MDFGDLLDDNFEDGENFGRDPDASAFGLNSQEMEQIREQKDAVIFLIDMHRQMHQPNPHNGVSQESNVEQVLRATLNFIKTKIITAENDKLSIIFYGCKPEDAGDKASQASESGKLKFKGVHVFYSLDMPDASLIKRLEHKIGNFSHEHGWYDVDKSGPAATSSGATQQLQASINDGASQTSKLKDSQASSSLAKIVGGASGSLSKTQQMGSQGQLPNSSKMAPSQSDQIVTGGASTKQIGSDGTAAGRRAPLFEALWMCQQEFKEVEKQAFTKRIFIFTDCDTAANEQDRAMSEKRAQDLAALEVDIELFPLPIFDQMRPTFDIKTFFASLITFQEDDLASGLLNVEAAQNRLGELMKRIRQKEYKKRVQGKCMFEISKGTKIALSFFTTVLQAKKPVAKKVNAMNNKMLQGTQKYRCKETDQVLYRNQIGTYYPLGGEKVRINQQEMQKIKNFEGMAGMQLMGFKPKSFLKVYHNIKHSTFVQPDEKKTEGASQCTDALIKEMLRMDRIAIVKFTPRQNSQCRFCALVPQDESVDPRDGYVSPAGFQLIQLPYADDLRDTQAIVEYAGLKKEATEPGIMDTLSKNEKNSAKLLVKNLNIDFDSRNFENPSLQKFFSGLQALALNEDEPEATQDLLEPRYDELKKFGAVFDRFRNTFYDGHNCDPSTMPKEKPKRPAARGSAQRKNVQVLGSFDEEDGTGSQASRGSTHKRGLKELKNSTEKLETIPEENPNKRRKLENGKSQPNSNQESQRSLSQSRVPAPAKGTGLMDRMKKAANSGKLSAFKKDELAQFMKEVDLPVVGNKPNLIAAIEEYFNV